MTGVHQARESLERKLDQWEAKAEAVEEALSKSRSEIVAKLESRREGLRESTNVLAKHISESKQLAQEAKAGLKRAFEHLQVQLALGQAETRDTIATQKKHVESSIAHIETALEQHLHGLDEKALSARARLVEAANHIEAHLEVTELYLEEEVKSTKLGLKEDAQSLKALLARFRADIEQKRRSASVHVGSFEKEMEDAFAHIGRAFKALIP